MSCLSKFITKKTNLNYIVIQNEFITFYEKRFMLKVKDLLIFFFEISLLEFDQNQLPESYLK